MFLNIKDGDIFRGIDIAKFDRKPILSFKNLNYIKLNQISPKPDKRYEIFLTNKGKEKQEKLRNFIENVYPVYKKGIEDFNATLEKFNLL